MREKKIAIFPGTFDPFTIGHQSIVKKALNIFDEIIISIGINESKKPYFSPEKRLEMINDIYINESRIKSKIYNTLTIDFAKKNNATHIIRGIRSVADFEYEKNVADTNKMLSQIETILFLTEPSYSHISSSLIRELILYGHDVKNLLPENINLNNYI